jgi:ribitol-5-phosphate 2-dehydrogenase (NADP+) / D-ribitol-5-phosphate cytidylyltransferase
LKNIAIILAAGSGIRSGFQSPKQLVKLAGKPVVAHAIKAFELSKGIDEIAIVTSQDSYADIESIVNVEGFKKVKKILLGGKERWESSWAAIEAYKNDPEVDQMNLIFHDAVRPLVDEFIVERVVQALEHHRAIDVVVNAVDTIIEVDESDSFIKQILNRAKLRNGQTPQGFRYNVIRQAYLKALEDNYKTFTDDCGIVMKHLPDQKIFLVEGSSYNTKLTYNEDLAIIDKLFQLKRNLITTSSVEKDYEEILKKSKDKVFVVFGGTSGIGQEMCHFLQEAGAKVHSLSRNTGCDISKIEDVESALESVYKAHGRIDYVVNSAGILLKQSLALMSYQDVTQMININYLGCVNVAYASHKYLKLTKGSLLLFTSSSYTYGRAFYSLYSSSKAAVVNFVQALADEWNESGIRVNCISPERTQTPMRVAAFGNEDPKTLLSAKEAAMASIKTIFLEETGLVIDVKRKI